MLEPIVSPQILEQVKIAAESALGPLYLRAGLVSEAISVRAFFLVRLKICVVVLTRKETLCITRSPIMCWNLCGESTHGFTM
jgi:hypothetical protein